jgi:hypothetical protein
MKEFKGFDQQHRKAVLKKSKQRKSMHSKEYIKSSLARLVKESGFETPLQEYEQLRSKEHQNVSSIA